MGEQSTGAVTRPGAVRVGTRGSPLALTQTRQAIAALAAAAGLTADHFELVVIRTTGDAVTDRPLAELGGKGLFTKELDEALVAGTIDLAVHSMKDVQTDLAPGIAIAAILPRVDPRDVLFGASSIAALPQGATFGTTSPRRGAQVRFRRPDVTIVPLRGNVGTRLAKVDAGTVQATMLALAGLKRLGIDTARGAILDPAEVLPAAAQGAVGVTVRAADAATTALVAQLNHAESATRVACERALLAVLDGTCRTPIAALAEFGPAGLHLRAAVLAPDGAWRHDAERTGAAADAERMGRDAGAELRRNAPGG